MSGDFEQKVTKETKNEGKAVASARRPYLMSDDKAV